MADQEMQTMLGSQGWVKQLSLMALGLSWHVCALGLDQPITYLGSIPQANLVAKK